VIKNCTYRIIPELNINVEYYSGIINVNDLVEVRQKLNCEKLLNDHFNFFVDLRDAVFDLQTNVVEEFISYVKSDKNLLWKRKTAILSLTPNQTAFSILYMADSGNLPMKIQAFSTMVSALKWVNLSPYDQPLIENVIEEIKKH